ncbi:MAG: CoA transferase, partial [Deltaproteobacteria bacterium]|nr:CoA transferase [Deltaproteobacteria bacterium]
VLAGGRGNEKWQILCEVLGRAELATDPRFDSYDKRITDEVRIELEGILEPTFRTKTTAEWLSLLKAADIPSAPVNTLEMATREAEAKGKIVSFPLPSGETARCMRNPLLLGMDAAAGAPPRIGEHSRDVLADVLGYSEERVRELAESRVVILEG